MIFKLMIGDVCLASYKTFRSAKSAYTLVDCALRSAGVDGLNLSILVQE
uniref:Uncharacterized protein n=1 Tax=Dulem virus 155 TaxID=3145632 RepID=A0AAU8B2C6_9VIRU